MSVRDTDSERIKDVVSMAIAIQFSAITLLLPDESGAPMWLITFAVIVTLRVIQKEVGRRLTAYANR